MHRYICSFIFFVFSYPYVCGFVFSIIIGHFVVYILWEYLYDCLKTKQCKARATQIAGSLDFLGTWVELPDPKASPWVPKLHGIIERAVFTTLVAWQVSGAASFIGAWITIKAAGMNWQTFTGHSEFARQAFGVSLFLSGLSALFGILGGLFILHMCPKS
jgi:hypothetical protein